MQVPTKRFRLAYLQRKDQQWMGNRARKKPITAKLLPPTAEASPISSAPVAEPPSISPPAAAAERDGGRGPQRADGITRSRPLVLAAAILFLVIAAAFANSIRCPFVFDATWEIRDNPAIRSLWPPWRAMLQGNQLAARPLPYLSFAIDYALHGPAVEGYHVVNLLIHFVSALLLFAMVRRCASADFRPPSYGRRDGFGLALVIALMWAVHPLQTAATTYVYQRMEVLMAMFLLLSAYCLMRGEGAARGRFWRATSVVACACGMASKEVMVVAPFVLWVYDCVFLTGSWRKACQRHAWYYLSLAATWGVLAAVLFAERRSYGEFQGLTCSPGEYALTQPGVILHYVRLAFWPRPLVLDYFWPVARSAAEVLPGMIVVCGLAAATVYALKIRPRLGFLGVWFFLILAPTSSVLPVADIAFEHRMYLPLAAIVTLAVLAGHAGVKRAFDALRWPANCLSAVFFSLAALIVFALAAMTWQRNKDYESEFSIWLDTTHKAPANPHAQLIASAMRR